MTRVEKATQEFLEAFEHVFGDDWDYTRGMIADDYGESMIKNDGTFLSPGVDDEGNNWANRECLLARYRDLTVLLGEEIPDDLPRDGEMGFE